MTPADSRQEATELRTIVGKCFSNRDIRLDGREYLDCSFDACRLIFEGSKRFRLSGNIISSDCTLVLSKKASETIAALEHLYNLGDWGRKRVINTLFQVVESLPDESLDTVDPRFARKPRFWQPPTA